MLGAWRVDQGLYAREHAAHLSIAKVFATEVAVKVSSDALQVLGAQGYMMDHPLERHYRDARQLMIVEGTSQGYLVWGNKNGTLGFRVIDNNRVIGPPTLTDLNNDGTLDVVAGTSVGGLFAVNLVGAGANIPGFPVAPGSAITLAPAVGDINGDGQTDIVVVTGPRTITAYPRTFPPRSRLTWITPAASAAA